jgi:hypothetical protein
MAQKAELFDTLLLQYKEELKCFQYLVYWDIHAFC